MNLIDSDDQPQASVASSAAIRESVIVADHRLDVFTEAPALFESMLGDIDQAKHRIWMETYIFAEDASGTTIAEALMRRAGDGLDVRLLYDAVGSAATPLAFFATMRQAGVRVHAYHNLWESLRKVRFFTILNRRDHRKLLVVDDTCAYFGGMNIIDHGRDRRYLKLDDQAAPMTGWRDLHIRMEGPQQRQVAESFERSWGHAKGLRLSRRPTAYRRVNLSDRGESIHFFDSGPGLKFSRVPRVYRRMLRGAQHSVVIAMAYFIPVGRVMFALTRLANRRIRVRIIVPARPDVRVARYATLYLYKRLLRAGFAIHERTTRMMHTKLMVIDRQWTILGSANMDPRSLYTNLEFMAVIRSDKFAAMARRICRHEIRRSRRVRLGDVAGYSVRTRFLAMLAWSMRWWL
ncbi:MAG: hypothetical protein HKL95_06220 [Phycisphaerae bacterium]|nr:hypothetical protein [Phycisphaerae bacterium]